jgi:hypothetical protein
MGVQSSVVRYPRVDTAYPLSTCMHTTSPTRYKAQGPMRDAAHNRRGPIRVLTIAFLTVPCKCHPSIRHQRPCRLQTSSEVSQLPEPKSAGKQLQAEKQELALTKLGRRSDPLSSRCRRPLR